MTETGTIFVGRGRGHLYKLYAEYGIFEVKRVYSVIHLP